MGAATEMVRLDTLPKDTVDKLLELAEGGGTGGGVLVVHQSGNTQTGYTLDKTWQEIFDADYPILVLESEYEKEYLLISNVLMEAEQSYIVVVSSDTYGTNSADGYPKKPGGK